MRHLVLGSSSPYRKELLARLRLDFAVDSPEVDETPQAGESASDYVERLARAKARAVGARHANALVIGCDQCADLDGALMGKPHTHDAAAAQLRRLSGQTAVFRTGLCLRDTAADREWYRESRHTVAYLQFDGAAAERYLRTERPYNCTAAFRSEGLGPALVREIRGADPSALIGLPLLALIALLRTAGVEIPAAGDTD